MSIDDIFRLGDRTIAQRLEIDRLRARNAELVEALNVLVADVDEYELVNNLAPNPGKLECWQSMTQARAVLAKAKGEK